MLTVFFRNDGTGDGEVGNYDVTVAVNGIIIERTRVEGHPRAKSWRHLVAALLAQDRQEETEE